ncbi:MAG TPA: RNA polymerase sigma factor ShbA [Actinophytocola sp.]|uniref:RNA polymerase sigma factor ShbA n=1 Tax=Actinophytocola sp. TaxID=1872138 RepID=UPI002DBCB860|nr:RNA polymerase sigma factor ShbA [Actinophytocola sp.]HEU5473244.1 RNA polymerase sigma factor ShbA [Actinophytocola sp.]
MLCTVEPEVDLAELEASWDVPNRRTPVLPRPRTVDRSNLDIVVAAAVDGDPLAAEDLLAFLRPIIVRYCRTKLGRVQRAFVAADDVAQEVCLAVFRALPTYRQLGRPFLSFVYGIAAHKVADVHRAAARDRSQPTSETPDILTVEEDPEQITLRRELVERTGVLLRTLTPRQRDILIMRIVLGLSAQETADMVGTTADAVRVAQHRALNRLRRTVRRPVRAAQ